VRRPFFLLGDGNGESVLAEANSKDYGSNAMAPGSAAERGQFDWE